MLFFHIISANGSADLRSPEKEVCFRSWDLANSQMCEVRVATSNICGCNPPNRCGERSGADFATSARRLPPPDVPPLRGRRTSIGFAKFPHASKLAEETSQSRRAVGRHFIKNTFDKGMSFICQ